MEKVRDSVGLPKNERGPQELEVAAGVQGMSETELNTFVDIAEARYRAKRMDPGESAPCHHATCLDVHAPALECSFQDIVLFLQHRTAVWHKCSVTSPLFVQLVLIGLAGMCDRMSPSL